MTRSWVESCPRTVIVAILSLCLCPARSLAQAVPAPLTVVSVVAAASGETVTVSGRNFGRRPLVTLDLLPLAVPYSNDSQIVAAVPVSKMPPGRYLLTVSRGTEAEDSASIAFVIEAGASAATTAAPLSVGPLPSATDPAATIGTDVLTIADLDAAWERHDPASYVVAARLLYEHRRQMADQLTTERLIESEAKRRNLSVEALLAEEIPKRRIAMPDGAVSSIYRGLGERARGATLEQMRPAIRAWLAEHTEPALAKMAFVEELIKVSTRVDIRLTAPKLNITLSDGEAALGPREAPVQLVAFGDFESEGYAAMAEVFPRIRDTFGDRVRIVFKHLPVLGPESVSIAEAAACTHAQGRFWPYHDAIVKQPGPFGASRLAGIAAEVGVDRPKFDRCVTEAETRDTVRSALDEAARYGVTESPSVMVNGRLAPPPPPFLPPFEFLKRVIEEELQRQSVGR